MYNMLVSIKEILANKSLPDDRKLLEIAKIVQPLPIVGKPCHVVGIDSWKDWDGVLLEVQPEQNRAKVQITRKKSGEQDCFTSLANVRFGNYPKKEQK